MTEVSTPYRARGRFLGRFEFVCPYCEWHAYYQLQRQQWKIVCKNNVCRKVLGIGTVVYDLSQCKGKMPIPPDLVIPARVVRYAKGDPLTRVVDDPPVSA